MGVDDLVENGHDVAVIDYHSGDSYENTASSARLSYYGVTGFPTVLFDGGNASVGGDHNNSLYSSYVPKVNQRLDIQSDFTLAVEGSNSGLIDYELNIEIENVGGSAASNIVLHVAVTESDIPESWQGQSEVNYVERLMAPNYNGTSLDFSGGDLLEETINFAVDPAWVNENLEVVVFVQNSQTKEALQAIKTDLSEFGTSNMNDAALNQVMVPQAVCNNDVTPKVQISNYGLDNLTSVDIVYDVNGETPITYSWTGDLATYESELIELDPISFTVLEQNDFNAYCENPNGEDDEFPSNNSMTVEMNEAVNVTSPVNLVLKLDDNPEETSWEVLNSAGVVLYSGGSYTTQGQFIMEALDLGQIDCYSFIIYDEGGDGLTGAGIYKLAHEGTNIFAEGKEFGFEDHIQFGIGLTDVESISYSVGMEVYPNPVDELATVEFTIQEQEEVSVYIYNAIGERVLQTETAQYSSGSHQIRLNTGDLDSGIYFIQLETTNESTIQKIVVK